MTNDLTTAAVPTAVPTAATATGDPSGQAANRPGRRNLVVSAVSIGVATLAIGTGAMVSAHAMPQDVPASADLTVTAVTAGQGAEPVTCTYTGDAARALMAPIDVATGGGAGGTGEGVTTVDANGEQVVVDGAAPVEADGPGVVVRGSTGAGPVLVGPGDPGAEGTGATVLSSDGTLPRSPGGAPTISGSFSASASGGVAVISVDGGPAVAPRRGSAEECAALQPPTPAPGS